MIRRISLSLWLPIVLQAPLMIWMISHRVHLTTDEIRVALSPMAEVSIADLSSEGRHRLTVQLPAGRGEWRRIRRVWGTAPAALIATSSSDRTVLDLVELNISAEPVIQEHPIPTRLTTYVPYGYSAATQARALEFDLQPGSDVEVRLTARESRRSLNAKLQVVLAWREVAIKDALDSAVMDEQLGIVGIVGSVVGGLI